MKTPKSFGWTEDGGGEVYGLTDLHVGPVPIAQWRAEGVARGARALLVTWDMLPFPPEPYPVFVAAGEDIGARFAEDGVGMQRGQAVHLLSQTEEDT